MKNISLIVSGVLAALVIYLFVEVQSLKKGSNTSDSPIVEKDGSESGVDLSNLDTLISQNPLNFPIAYVNLDSVTENLDYFKLQAKKIEQEMGNKGRVLQDREKKLAEERQRREKDLANGTYFKTQDQVAFWQKDFQERVLKFQEESYQYQQEITQKQIAINKETTASLKAFLKKYKAKKKYSYVLPQSAQLDILLYANNSLNITGDVIKALNAEYNAKSEKTTEEEK